MHAGGDQARGRDHPGLDLAEPRRPARPLRARPGPPRRRRRRACRQIRRSAGRLHPDRGRRGSGRLAALGRGLRGARRARRRRRNQSRRPAAALLHLRNDGKAEARAAQPSELSGRPFVDNVLARRAARRRPHEHFLAGLGKACLELLFRALERRRHGVHAEPAALQREGAARRDRALRGDDVLRPADRVADADPGGFWRPGSRASRRWSAPASR